MSPSWILLELGMTELVVTTTATRHAKLQSSRHHQQTNIQLFTGRMPFLLPNQQCQSTEKKNTLNGLMIKNCSQKVARRAEYKVLENIHFKGHSGSIKQFYLLGKCSLYKYSSHVMNKTTRLKLALTAAPDNATSWYKHYNYSNK